MNAQTKPPARDVLRAAIAARAEAAERLREASEAAARAKHLLARAEFRVAQRKLDDSNSRQLRVEALKAYALDPAGGPPLADLAADPPERQREREEAAAARAAYDQLGSNVDLREEEHRRAEARVAAAADGVLVDLLLAAYGRYSLAIEAARVAWRDVTAICGMTVDRGPRWLDRTRLPGLPDGLVGAIGRGFGHYDERSPSERCIPRRSAEWEDLRRRLRLSADAET
jgi:hypothetical protein